MRSDLKERKVNQLSEVWKTDPKTNMMMMAGRISFLS